MSKMKNIIHYIENTEDKDILKEIFICCKDRLNRINGQEKNSMLKEYMIKNNIKNDIEIKINTYCCDNGSIECDFAVGPMTFTYNQYITDVEYGFGRTTVMSNDFEDDILKSHQYGNSNNMIDFEDDCLKSKIKDFSEDIDNMRDSIKVAVEFIHFKKWLI